MTKADRITRLFPVAELQALGIPNAMPKGSAVLDRTVSTGRLHEKHQLLFRVPGEPTVWSVNYAIPLTDREASPFREDPVTATAMELRAVMVKRWRPVDAAPTEAG